MKTLNEKFTDEEFTKLKKRKGKDKTWRQFILESCLKKGAN